MNPLIYHPWQPRPFIYITITRTSAALYVVEEMLPHLCTTKMQSTTTAIPSKTLISPPSLCLMQLATRNKNMLKPPHPPSFTPHFSSFFSSFFFHLSSISPFIPQNPSHLSSFLCLPPRLESIPPPPLQTLIRLPLPVLPGPPRSPIFQVLLQPAQD